jgi:DNA-binding NtrC family response regulator
MDRQEWQIAVVSSDLETRQRVSNILNRQGYDPVYSSTLAQCRTLLAEDNIGLIFCDRNFMDGNYQQLLDAVGKANSSRVRIVLMASTIAPDEYHCAKRSGLFEAIASPCRPTDVEWMVIRARRDEFIQANGPFELAVDRR